ncbi:WD40-repeat-containing domain protein [Salix suchowensis]|nr:WD40-repeat-containing domain protein [Salix suchowensis]
MCMGQWLNCIPFFGEAIHRYDRVAGSLDHVMSLAEPNSRVLVKDGSGLIVSDGRKVHIVDVRGTTTQTLESHTSVISSISLSTDASLLASATSAVVHARVLGMRVPLTFTDEASPRNRTAIRGLRHHPPSSPVKTIPLDTSSSGDINAVSSSPFSKSLVAVSTTDGYLGLIDLEKEKGWSIGIPRHLRWATTLVDLRALEKPPKEIMVNPDGKPITAIAIQSKSQAQESLKKDKVASTSKVTTSSRGAVSHKTTPKSPSKPLSSKKSKTPAMPDAGAKGAIRLTTTSVQLENLSAFRAPTKSKVSTAKPDSPKVSKAKTPTSLASPSRTTASARPAKVSSPSKLSKDGPRKPRTMPTVLVPDYQQKISHLAHPN